MSDKILITNQAALQHKYGSGYGKIQTAIKQLMAADKARGLDTKVIAVDDPQDMQGVNGKPVTDVTNPRQNKNAVDAIYKATAADYLVLLGSIDIIPHQDLLNPLYDPNNPSADVDEFAFGDIPYACEAPYSQDPSNFIGPTRVVGRIPDLTNGSDPGYLTGLLAVAAQWNSRTADDYLGYLGITADVWKQSTTTSLQNTFGSDADLQVVPPKGPKWSKPQLSRLSHFINCHGAASSPVFYGQPVGQTVYPAAHSAAWIDGRISPGTVVAAECCYGAELYDPAPVDNQQMGICSTYLANGGYGFFGSTTIAYGPASGNASADLICQYFLQRIIAGSSLGRAALEARQQFAQSSATLAPDGAKTLAQFNLLADPSIQPVAVPAPHADVALKGVMAGVVAPHQMVAENRAARRQRLLVRGIRIGDTQATATTRTKGKVSRRVHKALREMARTAGVPSPAILSFDVERPRFTSKKAILELTEKISAPTMFHVAIGGIGRGDRDRPAVQIALIVAKELNGEIISVSKLDSR